jgi:HlyD family secretion protein
MAKSLNKKKIIWGIVGAAVVGLIGLSFVPKPLLQDFAPVTIGNVQATIHGEGKSRIRETYIVHAPITGRLQRIVLDPGDQVVANETIVATLEPADPQFLDARAVAQAEARIKAAEAQHDMTQATENQRKAELIFAENEFKRAEDLKARQNISERQFEAYQLAVEQAKGALASATSARSRADYELQVARAALIPSSERAGGAGCCIDILAPVSGRVLRLHHESQGVVTAGTQLLSVGDPADIEIVVDMLSLDAVKVTAGDNAYIDHWGGDKLAAKVKLVEPSGFTKYSALGIEEQRVNVLLDLTAPRANWMNLGDGYRVEAFVVVDESVGVMSVPVASLFRQNEKWSLYKVVDGKATLTVVEVGLRNELVAEIKSGVVEGDVVITHPSNTITDGTAVKDRK